MDRLAKQSLYSSLQLLDELWTEVDVVEVDQIVVERAAISVRRLGIPTNAQAGAT